MVAPRRIENVKFNEAVMGVSADGLVVMTWAFQAADLAKQAQNPGSNPGRRISFYLNGVRRGAKDPSLQAGDVEPLPLCNKL